MKCFDQRHASLLTHRAPRAWFDRRLRGGGGCSVLIGAQLARRFGYRWLTQQGAAVREPLVSLTVCHEAKVANLVQASGQDVEDEPAQEFHGIECLGSQSALPFVVFKAEGHLAVVERDQAVVGDGD